MPLFKQWVKAKRDQEDNGKRHGALSLVALCFTTGTQLPVRSCYIMLITITTTSLHLTFKATNMLCILLSVRVTLPHIGNIWCCFSNQQAAYVQTIRIAIVGREFEYLSLLAAWIAFIRIYVLLNHFSPFTHTIFPFPFFLPLSLLNSHFACLSSLFLILLVFLLTCLHVSVSLEPG